VWSRLVRSVRRQVPRAVRERVRLAAFRWLNLAWRRPSGVILRVHNESEWDIYNELFVDGEYDAAIDAALAAFPAPAGDRPLRVLDLGANVGFFTLRLIDRMRSACAGNAAPPCGIIAVEANPDLIPELRRRLAENALADRGDRVSVSVSVSVVHGLAGERSGTGVLYPYRANPGDSSIVPRRASHPARASGVAVSYVDLDSLTADAAVIDLLKCDIEGAELRVIENYPELLRKTRVIVFELHEELCDAAACRRLLAEAGFTREICQRHRETYALHAFARD
jgi:FkbM family methyltransferase